MVSPPPRYVAAPLILVVCGAAAGAGAPAEQLDPATRARLLLALLAIVVLGVGLIVLVVLGGRMVRRWSRSLPPSQQLRRDSLAARPVVLDDSDENDDVGGRENLDDHPE